jgi:hypothetical protein
MDRKKKMAYKYFETKKTYFISLFEELLNFMNRDIREERKFRVYKFIKDFEVLYGFNETFPIFIDWIATENKIEIPDKTTFILRNTDWLHQEGLSWTEILMMPGVKKSIRWVYRDGKVVETDDNKVSQ